MFYIILAALAFHGFAATNPEIGAIGALIAFLVTWAMRARNIGVLIGAAIYATGIYFAPVAIVYSIISILTLLPLLFIPLNKQLNN